MTDNTHDRAEELRAQELQRTVVRLLATDRGGIQARLQRVRRELRTFEINGPLTALPEQWSVLRERLADAAALQSDEEAEDLANRILDACLVESYAR